MKRKALDKECKLVCYPDESEGFDKAPITTKRPPPTITSRSSGRNDYDDDTTVTLLELEVPGAVWHEVPITHFYGRTVSPTSAAL